MLLLDSIATGARVSSETTRGAPDNAVDGQARCAAPPSSCQFPVRNVPGWRVRTLTPVMAGSKAHSRSGSGGRRGGRGWDTTLVIGRVYDTVVTVDLALILVAHSRLT